MAARGAVHPPDSLGPPRDDPCLAGWLVPHLPLTPDVRPASSLWGALYGAGPGIRGSTRQSDPSKSFCLLPMYFVVSILDTAVISRSAGNAADSDDGAGGLKGF